MTLNRTKYLGQLAVGRLRNNATGFRPLAGPLNLTVWESVEALEWFEKLDIPHFVMWWVPAGHRPMVTEAKQRLEYLAAHGSAYAFGWEGGPTAQLWKTARYAADGQTA